MASPPDDPLRALLYPGGVLALVQAGVVLFAVVAWAYWPHVFGNHTAEQVLVGLHTRPLAYVMKLDPIVLVGTVLQLPVFVALWAATRRAAPVSAWLGLVLAGVSTAACLDVRPIIELYTLAQLHAEASSAADRAVQVAAAEALLAAFHGTAWAISIVCGGAAGLAFARAMAVHGGFRRATVVVTALASSGVFLLPIPMVGLLALFVLGTLGGIAASLLYGLDLMRLGGTEPAGS